MPKFYYTELQYLTDKQLMALNALAETLQPASRRAHWRAVRRSLANPDQQSRSDIQTHTEAINLAFADFSGAIHPKAELPAANEKLWRFFKAAATVVAGKRECPIVVVESTKVRGQSQIRVGSVVRSCSVEHLNYKNLTALAEAVLSEARLLQTYERHGIKPTGKKGKPVSNRGRRRATA